MKFLPWDTLDYACKVYHRHHWEWQRWYNPYLHDLHSKFVQFFQVFRFRVIRALQIYLKSICEIRVSLIFRPDWFLIKLNIRVRKSRKVIVTLLRLLRQKPSLRYLQQSWVQPSWAWQLSVSLLLRPWSFASILQQWYLLYFIQKAISFYHFRYGLYILSNKPLGNFFNFISIFGLEIVDLDLGSIESILTCQKIRGLVTFSLRSEWSRITKLRGDNALFEMHKRFSNCSLLVGNQISCYLTRDIGKHF